MLWHRPDKANISGEEFDRRLGELVSGDRWIIDGNYQRTLEVRLQACDTVFLMDYPLELCLAGAQSRSGTQREDMPWVEYYFDEEFRQWIVDFSQDQLPQIYALLGRYRPSKEVIIFHMGSEAETYLNILAAERHGTPCSLA